ncbi:MAG: SDR family oxidoreductase [Chitinophagales bacterium]|nr:SDR family oxidoreductase [Chitinophagales bacterium]
MATKVWFITGASSGIGWAVALQALQNGDQVIGTSRQLAKLEELSTLYPQQFQALPLDVRQSDQIKATIDLAWKIHGRIDVCFSNAGQALVGPLENTPEAHIMEMVSVNYLGHLLVIKHFAPYYRQQGYGHIIINSAIAGFDNVAGFSVYGSAKAALEGLGESLKAELAPFGIHVSLLYLGPTRTAFIENNLTKVGTDHEAYARTVGRFARVLDNINGKQPGDPLKVADAIYHIAHLEQPPFRLFFGPYAYQHARQKIAFLQQELDQWESLGKPTDY